MTTTRNLAAEGFKAFKPFTAGVPSHVTAGKQHPVPSHTLLSTSRANVLRVTELQTHLETGNAEKEVENTVNKEKVKFLGGGMLLPWRDRVSWSLPQNSWSLLVH